MDKDKFIHDSKTVAKFIQHYCDNEHSDENKEKGFISLNYNGYDLKKQIEYTLCSECEDTLKYSYKKLQECPKEDKPSCRKCSSPCYDRREWKLLAKIMRYSGIRLGFVKLRKMFSQSL